MACWVGSHPLCANQSLKCLCLTITCCLWLYLNYEQNHTHTHTHLTQATNGHLVAKNTPEGLLKHQKLVHTHAHTFSHSEMITQCIHYTCWRLAWGKQLLIASNPLQFVWDHLSSLLCSSVVALWKPIGWQLMYGLLQSPPGQALGILPYCFLSDKLSISSSWNSAVLSSDFSLSRFCFTENVFLDHDYCNLHLPVVLEV